MDVHGNPLNINDVMRKIFETTRFVKFREAFSRSYKGQKKGIKMSDLQLQVEKIWNKAVYLMGKPSSMFIKKQMDPYGRSIKRVKGFVEPED